MFLNLHFWCIQRTWSHKDRNSSWIVLQNVPLSCYTWVVHKINKIDVRQMSFDANNWREKNISAFRKSNASSFVSTNDVKSVDVPYCLQNCGDKKSQTLFERRPNWGGQELRHETRPAIAAIKSNKVTCCCTVLAACASHYDMSGTEGLWRPILRIYSSLDICELPRF